LNTTHGYVEIDMKMKRKALERCHPPKAKTREGPGEMAQARDPRVAG